MAKATAEDILGLDFGFLLLSHLAQSLVSTQDQRLLVLRLSDHLGKHIMVRMERGLSVSGPSMYF